MIPSAVIVMPHPVSVAASQPSAGHAGLIDIASAPFEVLKRLHLSNTQIRALLHYRSTHRITRLRQLADIPAFGAKTMARIRPLILPLVDMIQRPADVRVNLPSTQAIVSMRARASSQRGFRGGPCIVAASWNICRMSLSKPDFALHIMAECMRHADIVALQEVMDEQVIAKLLMLLPNWQAVASKALGDSSYTEKYVYMWNATRICVTDAYVCHMNNVSRPPFMCTCTCDGYLLKLANFHATYGSSTQKRVQEGHMVMGELARHEHLCDILLGDFNSACTDDAWSRSGWDACTAPTLPTTIAMKPWDHIWRHPHSRVICMVDASKRAEAVVRYESDVYPGFPLNAVSDHFMIYTCVQLVRKAPKHFTATHTVEVIYPGDEWQPSRVRDGRYREISARILNI
jgi:endonuclease/exonuclease/phosphatase family metal-dependent hydrolase